MDGVSFIIPSRGRSKSLVRLLKSIRAQKMEQDYEIILICNHLQSSDHFDRLQNRCRGIIPAENFKMLNWPHPGVNRSRNVGLDQAKYGLVFFVDDDCELDDTYLLQKHVSLHFKKPEIFAVGGLYELDNSEVPSFCSRIYFDVQMRWLYQALIDPTSTRRASYLIGGHFSAKKNQIQKNKLRFNDEIIYGGSELSFFARAQGLGLLMELHDFSLLHQTEENILSLHQKIFKQGKGQAISEAEKVALPSPKDSFEERDLLRKIILSYLGWVYWLGYFVQKKNLKGFLFFILKTGFRRLAFIKFKILQSVEKFIESKKSRGDRL